MSDEDFDLRSEYDTASLEPATMDDDPIAQARAWLQAAIESGVRQANAVSLATADGSGSPSVRTVLLKELDTGFVVYTNYESRKARQIAENPRAALSITWVSMHRQIRVEGPIEKISEAQSDAYFATRPRGAQVAAVASRQSEELDGRRGLEARFAAIESDHPGEIARPESWGGYRVIPERVEFWQGRADRMHDRIEYLRTPDGWHKRRLSP